MVTQLKDQIKALSNSRAYITIVTSSGLAKNEFYGFPSIAFHEINIRSDISLFRDLFSLFLLWRFFSEQF